MAKKHWLDQINDSNVMQVVKLVDPTGISSYKDVYNAWTDGKLDYKDFTETLGALPLIGKVGKVVKYGVKGAEYAAKLHRGANALKKVQNAVNAVKNAKVYRQVHKVANSNAVTRAGLNGAKVATKWVGKNVVKPVVKDPVAVVGTLTNPREYGKFLINTGTLGLAGKVGKVAGKAVPGVARNVGQSVARMQGRALGALAGGSARGANIIGHGANLAIAGMRVDKVDEEALVNDAAVVGGAGIAGVAPYIPAVDNYLRDQAALAKAQDIDTQLQNRYDIYDNYMASRSKNTMRRGGSEDVMNLQRELNAELHARGAKSGYLREDGLMGPKTQAILDKLERLNAEEQQTGQLLGYE